LQAARLAPPGRPRPVLRHDICCVPRLRLPAHRDVLVAIGEFGHHRAGDPGLGFVGFSTFFLSSLAGRLPLIGSSISC